VEREEIMKKALAGRGQETKSRIPDNMSKFNPIGIGVFLLLLTATTADLRAAPQVITNDSIWRDSSGNEILAQGGDIIKVGSIFYWYGYDLAHGDVRCYSSTDLKNWAFVCVSYHGNGWFGRPAVLYNSPTGKFVMFTEASSRGGGRNALAYLTAATPTNVFTLVRKDNTVLDFPMGDHSVFKDKDGSAYLLATTDENGIINGSFKIIKFNADYLGLGSITMSWMTAKDEREAPSMLKVGSNYYLFTSHCVGWKSSETKYWKSTSLSNGWSGLMLASTIPFSKNSFNTQHNFEIVVTGSQGTTYIYAGDRYSQMTGVGTGKNAWFPLTIDDRGTPTIHGCIQWSIDVTTGLWSTNSN
jgi:hypothetical protein